MEGAIEEIEEEILAFNTTSPLETWTGFQYFLYTLVFISAILETITNLAFIYIYYKNKRLRSRTYTIMCNWFIWNLLSLLVLFNSLLPIVNHIFPTFERHQVHGCLSAYTQTPMKMAAAGFALALQSNRFVEYKNANMPKILIYAYVAIVFVTGTELLQCFTYQFFARAPEYALLFFYLANIITVIEKEVKRCRKQGLHSEDAKFRLNVSRLYSYNLLFWFFLFVALALSGVRIRLNTVHFLAVFDLLGTFYVFVYVYRVDHEFRECLMEVLRFGAVDTQYSSQESFSELSTQDIGHT